MESDSCFSDSRLNISYRRRKPAKSLDRRPPFIINTKVTGRIQSGGERSTARTNDSDEKIVSPSLNLTLYGSPAPRCFQRPAPVKPKKPVQPPNTPIDSFKMPKPLQLPIENILILNEKLELSKKEKLKLELSARQIKLSDDDDEKYSCRDCRIQEENETLSASTIDLSIDLSSVTNSDHETETSSDEMDCPESFYRCVPNKFQDKCDSASTLSQSPVHFANHKICIDSVRTADSSETSYPWTKTTRRSTGSSSFAFSDNSNESCEVSQRTSGKQSRSRSADLIYVYVNTVNNHNKLSKYFRTCQTCKEACCVCPDLDPETSRTFFVKEPESEHCEKEVVPQEENPEENKSRSRPTSRCSEFSNFLYERCNSSKNRDCSNDSGTSTLQLDSDSFRSGEKSVMEKLISSKKQVSLSMMQLATAAQCARILANSLESVLEMTVDQSVSPTEGFRSDESSVRFKNTDLDDLFKSFNILQSSFRSKKEVQDAQTDVEEELKWTNMENDFPVKENSNVSFFEDNFEDFLANDFSNNVSVSNSEY